MSNFWEVYDGVCGGVRVLYALGIWILSIWVFAIVNSPWSVGPNSDGSAVYWADPQCSNSSSVWQANLIGLASKCWPASSFPACQFLMGRTTVTNFYDDGVGSFQAIYVLFSIIAGLVFILFFAWCPKFPSIIITVITVWPPAWLHIGYEGYIKSANPTDLCVPQSGVKLDDFGHWALFPPPSEWHFQVGKCEVLITSPDEQNSAQDDIDKGQCGASFIGAYL
jgi:hypothetical protein